MFSSPYKKTLSSNLPILATVLILFSEFIAHYVHGENILFYTSPTATYSHRVGLEPLAIKLAEKGHNVTFFSPFTSQSKHPNVTDFCPAEVMAYTKQFVSAFGTEALSMKLESKYLRVGLQELKKYFGIFVEACEVIVKNSEVKNWLRGAKFDLVIVDQTSSAECGIAIAHKLGVNKIISYTAVSYVYLYYFDLYGMPAEVSWIPITNVYEKVNKPTFIERMVTELTVVYSKYFYTSYYLSQIDKICRDELDFPDMPPMVDLVLSDTIILLNGHYSDTFTRSLPPFIIPVGGMHLQESKGILSADLENFLDGSKDGFIYISFGTIVPISTLPSEYVKIFFDALGSFDQLKFLWKWEGDFPENIPKNVLLQKWFPQQDVLAHSKIRGFITQGGHVSIQQAIFNAVPLIIMPVLIDQDYNSYHVKRSGIGIELLFFEITPEKIISSINKLLTDESYSRIASTLSNASRQRPIQPLDLAVWWTEFVLRHDDVSYLKPGSIGNSWWVTRSLDVYLLIFLILILLSICLMLIAYYSIRNCTKFLLRNNSNSNPVKIKTS